MIDTSDVDRFAQRLHQASTEIGIQEELWAQEWGDETADIMYLRAPKDTEAMARSIRQTAPGEIEIGEDYWPYVEGGTAHMPPQPFIGPSVREIQPRCARDALNRAVRVI